MKIICIGRNYADHAKELNNDVPTEPVFFLKPDTAILNSEHPFIYPSFTKDLHHELELVIKINKVGKHIAEEFAHKYYSEISVGIDFTARDIQQEQKKKGLPWEKAKAFDNSAPVGKFIAIDSLKNKENIQFHLTINNNTVQQGESKNMIFNFSKIISHISQFITLRIGDLIFTGTPAGVSAVNIGDTLECFIENQSLLKFNIK